MIFWASSEVYQPVGKISETIRCCVESFLNDTFETSSLATLEVELRYIPIIMPEGMRERYPARSKLIKNEKAYLSAPQLDYNIFVSGTLEEQLREYIRGIDLPVPHLAGLGASDEQIKEFKKIIASAAEHILAEQNRTLN